MRRFIIQLLIILICFLLQTSLFRYLDLAGIVPNLLLIPTMAFGMMRGRKEGMLVGFFSGLLLDLFYGSMIGPYALLYMYLGYINGFFHRVYYMEDILLPMLMAGANDLIYNIIVYIFAYLLRNRLDIGFYLIHVILPEMVYTMIMTLFIYKPLVRINRWLKRKEEGSES
ncbi:MAG: rod shape-determining protein MreD [Bacteroides sp.]|nr:rod shape-determining protein MreD [Bacteroides sp.]